MTTQPTIEDIEDRFNSLPQDIQEAMDGDSTTEAIHQIGRTYRLHFDQIQDLAACVGYLMLGFTKPQDFINDLANHAEIPPSVATSIAKEVNEKILRPIKERLREVHDELAKKPKGPVGEEKNSNLFEQKMKNLFDQPTVRSGELRPSASLPVDNDPYRETFE